ncbi:MAG TPA: DUF4190 domain-containing protein [Verrucomicrobiae bacterium]|nr:DUF4190 domain-containing protein [Verrucomicrobiae bacterium]
MKPHRGNLILVFGILSIAICQPFGIAAWVMGNGDLKQIDAGTMDPSGRSLTNAGRICGIIGTILFILQLVIGIPLALIFAFSMMKGMHH